MRPDASENSQINPPAIVRASRAAGRHPHLASVLLQGRKSADIHASSGVIRGIPAKARSLALIALGLHPKDSATRKSKTVLIANCDQHRCLAGAAEGPH